MTHQRLFVLIRNTRIAAVSVRIVSIDKNIIMSSFKSSGDVQKKEGGPDSCFG